MGDAEFSRRYEGKKELGHRQVGDYGTGRWNCGFAAWSCAMALPFRNSSLLSPWLCQLCKAQPFREILEHSAERHDGTTG